MRHASRSVLALVLPLVTASAFAAGAPSQIVWQDRFDVGGHRDFLRNVVVADGILVVDGLSWLENRTHGGRRERATHISAYDVATGQLLWRQQFRAKGAQDLFVEDGTVLLTGYINFNVWAFDLQTGEALWKSSEREIETGLGASALADGILYTGGYWRSPEPDGFAVVLQAREARSGKLLWQTSSAPVPLGSQLPYPHVTALAAENGRLAVAAHEAAGPDGGSITLYDARTGEVLWKRPATGEGVSPAEVALCRNRLLVTGIRRSETGRDADRYVVRSLALGTGESLWEREFTGAPESRLVPAGLQCAGRLVHAAALSSAAHRQEDGELLLWALDRNRGATRWQAEFQGEVDFGRLLLLEGGSVFLRVNDQLLAYARRQGTLRWETDPFPEGGWVRIDLAPNGDLALTAAIFSHASNFDAVVRVLR